jgi:hypothetical protein
VQSELLKIRHFIKYRLTTKEIYTISDGKCACFISPSVKHPIYVKKMEPQTKQKYTIFQPEKDGILCDEYSLIDVYSFNGLCIPSSCYPEFPEKYCDMFRNYNIANYKKYIMEEIRPDFTVRLYKTYLSEFKATINDDDDDGIYAQLKTLIGESSGRFDHNPTEKQSLLNSLNGIILGMCEALHKKVQAQVLRFETTLIASYTDRSKIQEKDQDKDLSCFKKFKTSSIERRIII